MDLPHLLASVETHRTTTFRCCQSDIEMVGPSRVTCRTWWNDGVPSPNPFSLALLPPPVKPAGLEDTQEDDSLAERHEAYEFGITKETESALLNSTLASERRKFLHKRQGAYAGVPYHEWPC